MLEEVRSCLLKNLVPPTHTHTPRQLTHSLQEKIHRPWLEDKPPDTNSEEKEDKEEEVRCYLTN